MLTIRNLALAGLLASIFVLAGCEAPENDGMQNDGMQNDGMQGGGTQQDNQGGGGY